MAEMFISLEAVVAKMCDHMEQEFRKELIDQGHKLTGKLIQSIRSEVKQIQTAVEGLIYFEDYYTYLETGVSADKIPYGGRSGGTKSSKYIAALIDYWKLRGRNDKEARSAAFATAYKHKQEGIPTKASYSFSKNNRRTGFLSHTVKMNRSYLEELLDKHGHQAFQASMMKIIRDQVSVA